MSFSKGEQPVDLATMAATRRAGVSLGDVMRKFEFSKRTAQRMLKALQVQFPDLEADIDEEGRKRWRLEPAVLRDLMKPSADELAAHDLALKTLGISGLNEEVRQLTRLRDKIHALAPRAKVLSLETDHEVLLEAKGLAMRPGPGPRPRTDPLVSAAVAHAIKAYLYLDILYKSRGEAEPSVRRIAASTPG